MASRCWPATWSASSASRCAVVVTEDRYQGEDAAELVDIDYEPLPAVVDMAEAADPDAALLFPEAGTQRGRDLRRRGRADAGPVRRLRGRSSPRRSSTSGSRPRRWRRGPRPRCWGADGRVTAWIPNQGAQGTRGALAEHARPRPGARADHHPGRGRRVRRQVRRRPGARGGVLGGQAARPARALGRDPEREPGRDDARPGAGPDGHDRRPPGRDGDRLPAGDPAGLRRLPAVRRVPAVADHPHGAGPVRVPKPRRWRPRW